MKFNYTDIDDEGDLKYKFDGKYDVTLKDIGSKRPLFSYDFIFMDDSEYSVRQECFDNTDIQSYFNKLKNISSVTLNDLIDKSNYKDHFHAINNPNNKLKDIIKRALGKSNLTQEEMPIIAQLALYTNKELACRTKGIKSPRIFFMIGPHAVFYLIGYDPFHEVFNASRGSLKR